MKTSDILRAAWALIDAPEKWHRGWFRNASGARCSSGALLKISGWAIRLAEHDEALAEQQADGTLGELREIVAEQEFGIRRFA